ncbi:MAG: hypothetical protein ACRELB_13095, partial [Polyangiaceae bacterium]
MTEPLSEAFLEASRPELASVFGDRASLEARLQALLDAARGKWPAVEASARGFAAHLGARATDATTLEPTPGTVDLYLAFACIAGLA